MFLEKLEVVQQFFQRQHDPRNNILVEEPEAYLLSESYRFNYQRFFTGNPQEKLFIILQAEEHILGLRKERNASFEVSLLSQALSLCISRGEAPPGRGRFFPGREGTL